MQQFALCPKDCALKAIDKLTAPELDKLKKARCASCGEKYSENGKEFDKVRFTAQRTRGARAPLCTHDCLAHLFVLPDCGLF